MLARTNAELAPYAAAALEAGLPYRAELDGPLPAHYHRPVSHRALCPSQKRGAALGNAPAASRTIHHRRNFVWSAATVWG